MAAKDNSERIELSNNYLLEKLKSIKENNAKIQYVMNIFLSRPQLNIKQICTRLEYGERHFHRIFSREFGIPPKKFQCLLRINMAIKMMASGKFNKLTDIAYEAGYSDQAHFIKDFKSFTNMTPSSFLKNKISITILTNYKDEVVDGMVYSG
jgi:AraC-like DNA-binding protein